MVAGDAMDRVAFRHGRGGYLEVSVVVVADYRE